MLNDVKLQTKGFAVFVYLAVGWVFNVVLGRLLKVLLAAVSSLRFQRLAGMESYRNWLDSMLCALDCCGP